MFTVSVIAALPVTKLGVMTEPAVDIVAWRLVAVDEVVLANGTVVMLTTSFTALAVTAVLPPASEIETRKLALSDPLITLATLLPLVVMVTTSARNKSPKRVSLGVVVIPTVKLAVAAPTS
jgi:hypothetical protein